MKVPEGPMGFHVSLGEDMEEDKPGSKSAEKDSYSILVLYRDNGKENGNDYRILKYMLGLLKSDVRVSGKIVCRILAGAIENQNACVAW